MPGFAGVWAAGDKCVRGLEGRGGEWEVGGVTCSEKSLSMTFICSFVCGFTTFKVSVHE